MAKLRFAQDGHPYLIQGYEILDASGAESRFSTIQLHQRAEFLFREAGIVDGATINKPTFYALLLDGELYSEARPDGITISSVPAKIVREATGYCSSEFLEKIFPGKGIPLGKYTLDYYRDYLEQLSHQFGIDNRAIALLLASNYTIYVHAGEVSRKP